MNTTDPSPQTTSLADPASPQLAATIPAGLQRSRREAVALIDQAAEQAGALAQRGARVLRDTSLGLRDSALRASDSTALYVRDQPLKSMLLAAAVGAALMALVGLLTRSRHRS